MSTGSIKELLADVDVVAGDFRASAINTAAIRDQSVTSDKIASAAVTLTKLAGEVGVWRGYSITTTAGGEITTAFTTIFTAAFTLLACMVDVTVAHTVSSTLLIRNSAPTTMVTFAGVSATDTVASTNLTAIGTVKAIPIAADGYVKGVLSVASDKFKANVYLLTIATPT